MNVTCELVKTLSVSNQLGEGCLWRESDQTLWWTDILAKKLFKLSWGLWELTQFDQPQRLGSFGFIGGNDDTIIAGFETGFALYQPVSQRIEWLDQPNELRPEFGLRLNDGRVGPDGAFWCGSMVEHEDRMPKSSTSGLYRFTKAGGAERVLDGLQITNGICWNPDGTKIFVCDSMTGQILSANFDASTGLCGDFSQFAKVAGASPDGAITDSRGHYLSAIWGGRRISIFDSEGRDIASIPLSVPQPTCLCFCGPTLDHIMVTSARVDLDPDRLRAAPASGDIFIYKTNLTGRPCDRFSL